MKNNQKKKRKIRRVSEHWKKPLRRKLSNTMWCLSKYRELLFRIVKINRSPFLLYDFTEWWFFLCELILHKEEKRLTSIVFKMRKEIEKKIESTLSRRTMSVKYEVEHSEKKMQTFLSRITVYVYTHTYITWKSILLFIE
jgi:hypothetical protein